MEILLCCQTDASPYICQAIWRMIKMERMGGISAAQMPHQPRTIFPDLDNNQAWLIELQSFRVPV
jgi:hypothetical protein